MAKISMNRRSLHRRANEHTMIWLDINYELKEGICLPRCLLYRHYMDYMRHKSSKPIGAAAFGKLVRQKFPKITTRRLGTRGQSKYHYYGIGIKKSSVYFKDEVQVQNQNISNRIISREKIRAKYVNNRKHLGKSDVKPLVRPLRSSVQVLPQLIGVKPQLRHFPRTSDFVVPADVRRDQLSTFLLMYRSHCQRVLDTFLVANSEDIYKYLSHFWSGIPQHLIDVLANPFIVNVIECADSVLYSAIEEGLSPKCLLELPDQFVNELMRILDSMSDWIKQSMKESNLSELMIAKKLEVLSQFCSAIKRHLSFKQIAKNCKIVVSQSENLSLMCHEIRGVETEEIWSQISTLLSHSLISEDICNDFRKLKQIIDKDINFDLMTEWVDRLVDRHVIHGKSLCLTTRASQLVLALGTYLSGIIRDLTLNNAKSFGLWHLLFLTLEEYTLLKVWRSIRHESQSVRRLTVMKQPLNNCSSQTLFNEDLVVTKDQTCDDINMLISLTCYPYSDEHHFYDKLSVPSPMTTNCYPFDGQYYGSDQSFTDYTVEDDGSVYACLT